MKERSKKSDIERAATFALRISVFLRGGIGLRESIILLGKERSELGSLAQKFIAKMHTGFSISEVFAKENSPP